MEFEDYLRKQEIDEKIIEEIMGVNYPKDKNNLKQNYANFMAAAIRKCDELLEPDVISEIMYNRACCKTGAKLKNSRRFAKENKDKTIEEKLKLLGNERYMGKPFLNKNGDIQTIAVGNYNCDNLVCPCLHFGGAKPQNGLMPLSYCKCCGGHFRFHYQKALGEKLILKEVVSSILNSEGKEPCVFIYEIK